MKNKIKKIAVLTSGGDSPGMNPAIRAVVRTAITHHLEVYGIYQGYQGLLEEKIFQMNLRDVGNILQRGGTVLQSSRCPEFHDQANREKAANILRSHDIDALIVIGGDGSFNGAHLLSTENNFTVMGIPGTIDNDISGTQYTIGFDTALQTAVEAVDKIRDTASSHNHTFLIEVMGKSSGAIAMHTGICCGAEWVVLPGDELNLSKLAKSIENGIARGKTSSIIIVAEGKTTGLSYQVSQELKEKHNISSKVCVLGHTQRGGSPSALDRFRASHMGYLAVTNLLAGNVNQVTTYNDGHFTMTDLSQCLKKKNEVPEEMQIILETLSH